MPLLELAAASLLLMGGAQMGERKDDEARAKAAGAPAEAEAREAPRAEADEVDDAWVLLDAAPPSPIRAPPLRAAAAAVAIRVPWARRQVAKATDGTAGREEAQAAAEHGAEAVAEEGAEAAARAPEEGTGSPAERLPSSGGGHGLQWEEPKEGTGSPAERPPSSGGDSGGHGAQWEEPSPPLSGDPWEMVDREPRAGVAGAKALLWMAAAR